MIEKIIEKVSLNYKWFLYVLILLMALVTVLENPSYDTFVWRFGMAFFMILAWETSLYKSERQ